MLPLAKHQTARLIIHPLSFDDVESVQIMDSDRLIADTTISIPHS